MTMNSSSGLVAHGRWSQVERRHIRIRSVASCEPNPPFSMQARARVDICSFLYGDHSISPLLISRKMLVRILSYYQVMPGYLDFLQVFGVHKHSREKRFSGFREQTQLLPGGSLRIDSLGRSGCQFQLCYNLKTVARWTEPGQLMPSEDHWSIRQGAFHHQFDLEKGYITLDDSEVRARH